MQCFSLSCRIRCCLLLCSCTLLNSHRFQLAWYQWLSFRRWAHCCDCWIHCYWTAFNSQPYQRIYWDTFDSKYHNWQRIWVLSKDGQSIYHSGYFRCSLDCKFAWYQNRSFHPYGDVCANILAFITIFRASRNIFGAIMLLLQMQIWRRL